VLWGGQKQYTCTSQEYANIQFIYDPGIGYSWAAVVEYQWWYWHCGILHC